MIIMIIIIILTALLAVITPVFADSFALVDGQHCAVITLPNDPSPSETLAANEIRKYVKLMSGVELELVKTSKAPVGSVIISTGGSDLGDEGYSIGIRKGNLHLQGARGRSVLYAAYDLLERLGCRWLAPGFRHYQGRAEFVPRIPRLVFSLSYDVTEKPRLKFRKLYVEEGLSHTQENLLQMVEWMVKSRFNTLVIPTDYQGHGRVKWDNWRKALTPELQKRDIQIEVGGHGYQNFLNAEMEDATLFEKHPEWFGMDEEGNRQKARRYVLCTSNDEAVRYLIKNVVAYLQAHPEIDIFDFWPPDGARWCCCPECAKLGPASDRQARLIRQVLEEVKTLKRNVRFETIAYSATIDPPKNPQMDQSVLIDFCPIAQCFEVQINDPSSKQNARYAEDLQAWIKEFAGDISIYSYYRKYAWKSLPVIIPHYMQADLRWYISLGVDGISSYAEPGDWQTYELNHYTLARLAWNPECDVDKVISDFCTARHGQYAGKAFRVYRALEDVVRRACSIPGTSLKSSAELDNSIKRLQSAKDALSEAAEPDSVSSALPLMVDYAIQDLRIRKHIADGGAPEERAKMVDSLVEFLKANQNKGLFINRGSFDIKRLTEVYKLGSL